MLPQFYIDYFKAYLPSSEFLTLQILVWLLQAHLLARALGEETSPSSLVRLELKG
jgi:hypothetical protein